MMKQSTKVSMLLVAAAFGGASTASMAAGSPDFTDTMKIDLNKNQLVNVTSVDDIDFGTVSDVAVEGLSATDKVCVFSNSGAFELTLTTANGTTNFGMSNGVSELEYGVLVEQTGGGALGFLGAILGGSSQQAQSGVAITGLESSAAETCTVGAENLDLTITVAQADFDSVSAGQYTDTLTVFVKPE